MGGPPDIPGSPLPAMPIGIGAREITGMPLRPGVVGGVITEPGTPRVGKGVPGQLVDSEGLDSVSRLGP